MPHHTSFLLALTLLLATLTLTAAPADRLDRAHKQTARRLNFKVVEKPPLRGGLAGLPLPADELNLELENFFAALAVLPEEFIRKSGLNKVAVCDSLRFQGMPLGGVAIGDMIVMNRGFTAATVYHEFFHIFDPKRSDQDWLRLNPKEFIYEGNLVQPEKLSRRKRRQATANRDSGEFDTHFASQYAKSHESEDRAETFAWMLSEPRRLLLRAAKSDPLRRKIAYIIEMTDKRSLMPREFWQEIFGADSAVVFPQGTGRQR